jgi:hypothetical protein
MTCGGAILLFGARVALVVKPRDFFDREAAQMKRFILLAVFTIIGQQLAVAAPVTATGPTALALAAVIAPYSPLFPPRCRCGLRTDNGMAALAAAH